MILQQNSRVWMCVRTMVDALVSIIVRHGAVVARRLRPPSHKVDIMDSYIR